MKLALALFKYFPYGGLQRNFLAIARELAARGHAVTVYTGTWEGELPQEFPVEVLPVQGWTNPGRNRSFHQALQRALADQPADVVVGFNKMPDLDVYYCADTCFATRVFEEKPWLERLTPRVRWSLRFEEAVFAADRSTRILLLSAAEGEAYQKYYRTQSERLLLMPPGINRDRVRGADADAEARGATCRSALGLAPDQKVVTFLGSDYKRKGLSRLLAAVAALPPTQRENTQVLVIGRDKREDRYRSQAEQLGIGAAVHFLGQRDDIPDLLFASNLLAHPAHLENTGNVIVEALVAGVPVLCSGTCGYAHYVRDNALGAVVEEPFDQNAMNVALAELLASERDWRTDCAAFAATADVFSRPRHAADAIELSGERT